MLQSTASRPCRFTPTCVGQTESSATVSGSNSVHPHLRGADPYTVYINSDDSGSPPPAWGRLIGVQKLPLCIRFTPTCVGQTRQSFAQTGGRAVHPHLRGADVVIRFWVYGANGSPPPAWGRPWLETVPADTPRFTPTCVGQTNKLRKVACAYMVHPHLRGADPWRR